MKVLIPDAAGLIGSALTLRLLERGDMVIGIDNHSDHYEQSLKEVRLARYVDHPGCTHLHIDLVTALQWRKLLRFMGRIA